MKTSAKYPGRTDALLSMLCVGLTIVVPFTWLQFRLTFVTGWVVTVVCMLLWGLSWGLAISAVRLGEGSGKALGKFALALVALFSFLLIRVLMPAV